MKIALCGKMGAGKTFIADKLVNDFKLEKYSFASKVKELATELFGMVGKDRLLLQTLADKMKDIDKDVWVKYTINSMLEKNNIVVDDLRFHNELNYLRNNGFITIKLLISEETQGERLLNKYGEQHYKHLLGKNHNSECFIDELKCDFELVADDNVYEKIKEIIHIQ